MHHIQVTKHPRVPRRRMYRTSNKSPETPRMENASGKQVVLTSILASPLMYPLWRSAKGCAIALWENLSHWESGFLFSKNKLTNKIQKIIIKTVGNWAGLNPETFFLFSSGLLIYLALTFPPGCCSCSLEWSWRSITLCVKNWCM